MKKMIRYLYEYENGRKARNTGFVRIEEETDRAVIKIYGNGFPAAGQKLEVFLFYMEGGDCIGIRMGEIQTVQPSFGYRLEYGPEDFPEEEIFFKIGGMILKGDLERNDRWYAAIWEEGAVDVQKMILWEEHQRNTSEPEEREMERREETVEPEMGESIREVPAENRQIPVELGQEPERELEREPERELERELEREPERELERELEQEPEREPEGTAERGKDLIYKIAREDLVQLPRKEWFLANQNFLLHGYYNYHHLVSFEKDGKCWLGVPGIYHEQEQRAASTFGFGQFMRPDEGEIELKAEEMNENEDFGYWCRAVSSVIIKEKK